MPYNPETSAYERRAATVIDATPDGDTVAVAIDVKLDQGIDDYVLDLNHHNANGNHYPATSVDVQTRFLKQSPAGEVTWADGVPAPNAALTDFSNVASGAIAPAKIAQDASTRFFTDTERTKLTGIATGAQVNSEITKAEIEAKLTGSISTHTHAAASESAAGLVELATSAETTGLADTGRAIVPASLLAGAKAALNASGSAPVYACRAWVNFDGVNMTADYGNGANGIRGFGNVSSVTRNSTGDYTINFTTAIEDTNYAVFGVCSYTPSINTSAPVINIHTLSAGSARVITTRYIDGVLNLSTICMSIVR